MGPENTLPSPQKNTGPGTRKEPETRDTLPLPLVDRTWVVIMQLYTVSIYVNTVYNFSKARTHFKHAEAQKTQVHVQFFFFIYTTWNMKLDVSCVSWYSTGLK